jgi:hypothetical protein
MFQHDDGNFETQKIVEKKEAVGCRFCLALFMPQRED